MNPDSLLRYDGMRISFTAGNQVKMHMMDALTGNTAGVRAEIESFHSWIEGKNFTSAGLDQCKHPQQYSGGQIKYGLVMRFADNQGMQICDRMGVTDGVTEIILCDDFKIIINAKYAIGRHDWMFGSKVIDFSLIIGDTRLHQKEDGHCNKYFTIELIDKVWNYKVVNTYY